MNERRILAAGVLLVAFTGPISRPIHCQEPAARVVIAASTLLDGRGGVLRDTRIVIAGSRIVAIDPKAEPVTYDLRALTVLPGWIDSHVHMTWHFGPDGKNAGAEMRTPFAALAAASNAWATLMAGFTTVQSVGSAEDLLLHESISRGLPGPRILTAVAPLLGRGDSTGTPEEMRAYVRTQKRAGADVIKLFATFSAVRPGLLFTQAQLDAICDEARKQGLRTLVHAYGEAVRAATLAGCNQIEHGALATDDDLRLMASSGTYLDPQAGLVWENYVTNSDLFIGTPGYPTGAFSQIEAAIARSHAFFRQASAIPGLKIVFGSDALAGSHGRNAEEFIHRVQDGATPMAAMVSANSLAAEALGMADRIGSIAAGFEADIIGLDGNPLSDMTAVRRVRFVMKGGIVHLNVRN
jgi:imidazolonepropionase-like amidohydrolase